MPKIAIPLTILPRISPEGRVGGAKAAVRRASSRREPRQSCEEIPKIPPPLGVGQTPWSHGYVTTFGVIEWHPDRDALSTSRAAVTASPERCSDLRARVLDTMMLLLATTCFVHAHDVSQGRSRRASRRAVCLTPVIDAADAQKIMSTKAAREVLTTDAMNHLVSFGPCINSCRLPALAPIHSPCPEWSCNVCLYPAPCPCTRSGVRHVVCVSFCVIVALLLWYRWLLAARGPPGGIRLSPPALRLLYT